MTPNINVRKERVPRKHDSQSSCHSLTTQHPKLDKVVVTTPTQKEDNYSGPTLVVVVEVYEVCNYTQQL